MGSREIELRIESNDVLGWCDALRSAISRDLARRLRASWIPSLLCGTDAWGERGVALQLAEWYTLTAFSHTLTVCSAASSMCIMSSFLAERVAVCGAAKQYCTRVRPQGSQS